MFLPLDTIQTPFLKQREREIICPIKTNFNHINEQVIWFISLKIVYEGSTTC